MQVITRMLWGGLDQPAPVDATEAVSSKLDKKLKTTVDSFMSFADRPFQADVVVVETPEDYLE